MLPEEKQEVEKEEDKTSGQDASTDETKTADKKEEDTSKKTDEGEEQEDEDGEETLSKKEAALLRKKASDYDAMIQSKRLAKLLNKEEKQKSEEKKTEGEDGDGGEQKSAQPTAEEIMEQAKKIAEQTVLEAMGKSQKESYETNLKDAYHQFLKDNPWADTDEAIAKISGNFNPSGSVSKEELLAKLDIAAQHTYPADYRKAQESRIRAQILAEEEMIKAGEGGGSSVKDAPTKAKFTPEQAEMARKSGNNPEDVYKS